MGGKIATPPGGWIREGFEPRIVGICKSLGSAGAVDDTYWVMDMRNKKLDFAPNVVYQHSIFVEHENNFVVPDRKELSRAKHCADF